MCVLGADAPPGHRKAVRSCRAATSAWQCSLRASSLSSALAASTVSLTTPAPRQLALQTLLPRPRSVPLLRTVGPAGPLASLGHRLQLPSECSLAEVLSGWWWPAPAAGFISQTSGTWSRPACGDSAAKHTGSTGLLFSNLSPCVGSRPASRLCLPSLERNLMWEAWLGGFGPLHGPSAPRAALAVSAPLVSLSVGVERRPPAEMGAGPA